MAQFIKKYVDGCAPCQQNKTNTHPTIPPLNPIISRETLLFKQISYDPITDLPISNGFDSLLVMVDQGLSKGVILCPTKKTITAKGVATIIFRKLYTRFGLFNKVISDWGPNSQQNSKRNSEGYLDTNLPYHPPITHRLMERLKGSTKKSRPTSGYSVDQILLNRLNKYLWLNSSITSNPTLLPANLHFISSWDMNHKHFLTSLTKPTFRKTT